MTEREALKLALEALEEAADAIDSWGSYASGYFQVKHDLESDISKAKSAITAIKEALAQSEQEPVAWKLVPIEPTDEMLKAMDECSTEGYDERLYAGHAASVYMAAVDVAPIPPQQNPKCGAIIEVFGKDWRLEYMSLPVGKHKLYTQQYTYTASPQRTWVGLTDDDKVLIKHDANFNQFMTAGEYADRVQQLTEARLKDLNT